MTDTKGATPDSAPVVGDPDVKMQVVKKEIVNPEDAKMDVKIQNADVKMQAVKKEAITPEDAKADAKLQVIKKKVISNPSMFVIKKEVINNPAKFTDPTIEMDKKDKKENKDKKDKAEKKDKKDKKGSEKKEKKEKKDGKEKKEKKSTKEKKAAAKPEVINVDDSKTEMQVIDLDEKDLVEKRSGSPEEGESKKRKTKWGDASAKDGSSKAPATDTTPRFTAAEMLVRTVVVENFPPDVTGPELMDFFNGAVLAVTSNQIQQATNLQMAPIYQCSIRVIDGPDGQKRRIAELRFRTPEGAHVGIKLNSIEYKNVRLLVHRPEGYEVPETGDPSKSIILDQLTMPLLLGRNPSQEAKPAQRLSIFNVPVSMPETVVQDLLSQFGTLRMLNLIKDATTGSIKGYGFFEYDSDEDSDIAVLALNGMVCGQNVVRVQKLGNQQHLLDTSGAPVAATAMTNSMTQKIVANPAVAMQVRQGREVGARPSQVVQLLNTVYQKDLMDDQEYEDILKEINDEALKHGNVSQVHIPKPARDGSYVDGVGKVFVKFQDITAARRFQTDFNGRKFDDRVMCAAFYPLDLFREGRYTLNS